MTILPPIDRASFSRLVGRLDRATFEQFVADLWAARGWRTSMGNGTVIAEREGPGGGRRHLAVEPANPSTRMGSAIPAFSDEREMGRIGAVRRD